PLPRRVVATGRTVRPVAPRRPGQRARGGRGGGQQVGVQGGGVRRLGRLCRRRRRAARDQHGVREPELVPDPALALPARRRRRRLLRLDLGRGAGRAPDPVPARRRRPDPAGRHQAGGADDLRVRRGARRSHARPAARRAGSIAPRESWVPSPAMTRSLLAAVGALVALSLAGIAGAAVSGTPGVSSSKITIGSSGPLTGQAAAAAGVLRGADAYFKYVNARGGVYGRKIDFKYLDDAYNPSQTVANVRQLVQEDNVFALFSIVGTNANLAVRDFTNAAGVPQVFSAAGATTLGRDYAKYPWTIGYLPPYTEEGKIYARQILATNAKKAKIGVLYQSDDYGEDMLSGFRQGLGANRNLIVQTVGYDPTTTDVQSQVAQLKGSGANTFAIFAFGKFAIQAFVYASKLGWKPQIYVNDVASASSIMKL